MQIKRWNFQFEVLSGESFTSQNSKFEILKFLFEEQKTLYLKLKNFFRRHSYTIERILVLSPVLSTGQF